MEEQLQNIQLLSIYFNCISACLTISIVLHSQWKKIPFLSWYNITSLKFDIKSYKFKSILYSFHSLIPLTHNNLFTRDLLTYTTTHSTTIYPKHCYKTKSVRNEKYLCFIFFTVLLHSKFISKYIHFSPKTNYIQYLRNPLQIDISKINK